MQTIEKEQSKNTCQLMLKKQKAKPGKAITTKKNFSVKEKKNNFEKSQT